jgi:hypothetical protein
MKKIYLLAIIFFVGGQIKAQQWTTSGTNIYNSNTGNVGIGTTTPAVKFQLAGTFYLNRPANMQDALSTIGVPAGSQITIAPSDLSSTNNSYMALTFPTSTSFRIASEYDGHLTGGYYRDIEFGRYGAAPYMVIKDGGTVGIGTTTPGTSNKLSVEGQIGARAVKVTMAAWSDFVFYPNYNLTPILELESFINKNKHLPNIPTEQEVKKDGIDLGQMNAELLRKIEELTLYVIELKKENEKITATLKKLNDNKDAE